jgi:hypothetical protein
MLSVASRCIGVPRLLLYSEVEIFSFNENIYWLKK